MDIGEFLVQGAREGILPWRVEAEAALEFGLDAHAVEAEALGLGLRLERYARNFNTIDQVGQRALHASRVIVVGCGGLGGHIVEELARIGVGSLVIVDSDSFEPSNLNRQILATIASLGRPKVQVASERVAAINPATTVGAFHERFDEANADRLLSGCAVAADALDNIPSRLLLGRACARAGIPLVHGAIAGWYVQATTVAPGAPTLEALYAGAASDKGIEVELGNPSFTPAIAASLEVAEIVKLLLGRGAALEGNLLHFDLGRMEAVKFPL
ncbi:MAG: HesA/MoeB/ThiF family protein [Spirochaetota bacterium]